MATAVTTAAPKNSGAYSSTLYSVIENLKDDAIAIFNHIESDSELSELSTELGQLRDRADAIQTVVLQHIDSIASNL